MPGGTGVSPRSEEAQEDLQESQRMLASVLSNLHGLAYRCLNDPEWTILFMSDGCLELTGYEAADLVGSAHISFNQLIYPSDRERVCD